MPLFVSEKISYKYESPKFFKLKLKRTNVSIYLEVYFPINIK